MAKTLVGRALRGLRESQQLSQREVAALLGVSQSVICEVELGHRLPDLTRISVWMTNLKATDKQRLALLDLAAKPEDPEAS